jgi:hypothetical protein
VAVVVDLPQPLTVEPAVVVQVETQESAQQEQQTQAVAVVVVVLTQVVELVVRALLFFLIPHHLRLLLARD